MKATMRGLQKNYFLIGGDTETCNGLPMTLQFHDENGQSDLLFVDETDVMQKFLNYLAEKETKKDCRDVVVFFHNLGFDLPILLYPIREEFSENQFEYDAVDVHTDEGFKINAICSKVYYCKIRFFKGDRHQPARRVYIIDSAAFIRMALKRIAEELNLPRKMETPEGLGERLFTRQDSYFMDYAKRDALVEYELGRYILNMHKEFNVPLCISTPQLSQRIFTRNFYPKKCETPLPPNNVVRYSILSYHGGKNGYYIDGMKKIPNVYELDVTSMYPFAMTQLPPWTKGHYKHVNYFDYEHVGIYCISGIVKKCKYKIICGHDFKYIEEGHVQGIWIPSYELFEALKNKEIELKDVWGYVWIPAENAVNPFKDFVDYFFKLKQTCTDSRRLLYKLILCSLYGKTIQNVDHSQPSAFDVKLFPDSLKISEISPVKRLYKAGGLFNPFLATLITSFSRAYLHRIEHKYEALDSSTDSIKTIKTPDIEDIDGELGGLNIKAEGDCLFFRNKLYLMFDKTLKYALHGFEGRPEQLLKCYLNDEWNYKYTRMLKIRESLRRGLTPFVMTDIDAMLNIPGHTPVDAPQTSILEGFEDDLIDHKALKDSKLTAKENKENIEKMMREYKKF